MSRFFLAIFLLLFLYGCQGDVKPEKPNNLIDKNKMAEIIYDLYVINGSKTINRKLLEKNGFIPETYIFTKYSIDSIQFAESNNYYAFDTDAYREIIDKVKSRLEKEKDNIEEVQKKQKRESRAKQDSIQAAAKKTKDSIINTKD